MGRAADALWELTQGNPNVDVDALAYAVGEAAEERHLDYRTRHKWGTPRLREWLKKTRSGRTIEEICKGQFDETGFPSLSRRLVNANKPEDILNLLRELSQHVNKPTRIIIGGSIALLLAGALSRHTEDIDIVDEVPGELRDQHELMEQLAKRYGLHLARFKSHYLPIGWENRLHSVDVAGKLQVFTIDPLDVLVGKLFSVREKDRDDLRAALREIEKAKIVQRLRDSAAALLQDARLRDAARQNWYILFGEELPR